MSDETFHDGNQGWPPEPSATQEPSANTGEQPSATTGTEAPKAFCQDCGKPLTPETLRTVGTGVFCEPCLTARVSAASPYAAAPPIPGAPHPVLAGLLGVIPGVGAMYNGQYSKGFAHLIIFALLSSLGKHNDFFGIFCFAWVCYMVFDAYHTARARLLGMPLPNPFNLNDIGERMGYGKTWSVGGQQPNAAAGTWTSTTSAPTPPPPPSPPYTPPTAGPDWVGYVPPTEFGAAQRYRAETEAAAYQAASAIRDQALRDAGYKAPYAQTYTGAPASEHAVPYVTPVVPPVPPSRFPVGALWLIGLGVLILLANLVPSWNIDGRWFPPVIFLGLAVLLLQRRMRFGRRLICNLRWPVILLVLAVMTGLHAANFAVTFGLTCAVLLIALGALLLLERTVGAMPVYPTAPPTSGPSATSFTSTGPSTEPTVGNSDDSQKGGQA